MIVLKTVLSHRDVKASRLYRGKQGEFYTFNLESKYPKCDFYIAYCINESDVAEKVLIIPACVMAGKSQLSRQQKT